MTDFTILDKEKHRNTRIITERGEQYGENIHLVPVIAEELNKLVLEYPVCLIKNNDTGQFGLHALLGFEPQENLYLNAEHWQANYLPLHIQRQPFHVAVKPQENASGQIQDQTSAQLSAENTVITINMDNTRVQENQGELLFDDAGNATPFMNSINTMLSSLVNGIVRTDAFIAQLSDLDLIEAIHLNVSFANGEKKRFDGIYTINEEKLKTLSAEQLHTLNNKGYLQACYLLIASMGHVQKLIALKKQRLTHSQK